MWLKLLTGDRITTFAAGECSPPASDSQPDQEQSGHGNINPDHFHLLNRGLFWAGRVKDQLISDPFFAQGGNGRADIVRRSTAIAPARATA